MGAAAGRLAGRQPRHGRGAADRGRAADAAECGWVEPRHFWCLQTVSDTARRCARVDRHGSLDGGWAAAAAAVASAAVASRLILGSVRRRGLGNRNGRPRRRPGSNTGFTPASRLAQYALSIDYCPFLSPSTLYCPSMSPSTPYQCIFVSIVLESVYYYDEGKLTGSIINFHTSPSTAAR